MNRIFPFLVMIRWPNLLMTVVGVVAIWYYQIYRFNHEQPIQVDFTGILLFSLALMLIMGAGYIVNDIFDVEIDRINKPLKNNIGKQYSVREAWIGYSILNIVGTTISVYTAYIYHKIDLLLFLVMGISMLYIYSKWLKQRAPWGNILISVLCALVLWMPAFVEWELVKKNSLLLTNFLACSVVGGLCMFMRELVKSQEDYAGDKLYNVSTLPVSLGLEKVKKIVIQINLFTILIITIFLFYFPIQALAILAIIFLLIFPLLVLHMIFTHKTLSLRYSMQSKILKLIMAAGMLILPWALSNFRT